MRYLGVDFGEKRIGLAICDPSETLVSPLGRIDRRDDAQAADEIARTVREEEAGAVVVGLPANMDDTEGPQAARVRRFIEVLAARLTVPLHLQNEQLSTFVADERLDGRELTKAGRRRRQDALAAAVILEDFLKRKAEP